MLLFAPPPFLRIGLDSDTQICDCCEPETRSPSGPHPGALGSLPSNPEDFPADITAQSIPVP